MNDPIPDDLLVSYCYGPVDITAIHRHRDTLSLTVLDCVGKTARAVYRGCTCCQLDRCHTGLHLSLVQQFSVSQLSKLFPALQQATGKALQQMVQWEAQGMSFFLHIGNFPEKALLIVAQSLEYQETE